MFLWKWILNKEIIMIIMLHVVCLSRIDRRHHGIITNLLWYFDDVKVDVKHQDSEAILA